MKITIQTLTIWELLFLGHFFRNTILRSQIRKIIPRENMEKKHTEQHHPGSVVQIQQIWVNNYNIWGGPFTVGKKKRKTNYCNETCNAEPLEEEIFIQKHHDFRFHVELGVVVLIFVESSTHSSRNW